PILNSIEKHKVFGHDEVVWDQAASDKTLIIKMRSRRGSQGYCSGCVERARTYDTMKPRRFQFAPLWSILVFLVYAMRRIDCKTIYKSCSEFRKICSMSRFQNNGFERNYKAIRKYISVAYGGRG
ncbi:MAG: hypothetical protein EBU66_14630, partial [Bacteroidetes bacterium]|nr:hypothetical protein [Bacteroidota bacterium]